MADSDEEASFVKKAKVFCCKTFREDLKTTDVLKSLKKFVSAAKNSDDVIYEYLENGGSLLEILLITDKTAKGDLTTALPVFEAVHLILMSFQSPDSKYHQQCIEGAKTILRCHLLTIKAMLAMNITKHKKVALKLLTAIVTLHSSFASEVMNMITFTPIMISELVQPRRNKDSLRKCFIFFILSFLIDGNISVLKTFLDKKGYLASIIPGLKFDDASTVNVTLSLFENKILKNSKIQKTLKLKIFNTQNIKALFDLYDWKGLQGVKQVGLRKKHNKIKEPDINEKEKELVVDSVHSFLLLLCSSKKFGVAFGDKSLGSLDQLNNQLLFTVFESLVDPLKNKKISEVLLKTMVSCPDLLKPVLSKLEPAFQPRNSSNWFAAIDFAENLIKEMNPSELLKTKGNVVNSNQITKVVKSLCSPIVFLKICKSGAQNSESIEIRMNSLKLLSTMWTEIQKLLNEYPKFKHDLRKSILYYITKFLPDAGDLVELWHNLCNTSKISTSSFIMNERPLHLFTIINLLQIMVECQKDTIGQPLNLISDLLKHLESIREEVGNEKFNEVQIKVMEFVEIDLKSLTPDMDLFEKSLKILLQSPNETSISLASKILTSTGIFRLKKAEVDVWLACYTFLSGKHRLLVVEFLIDCFKKFLNAHQGILNFDLEINGDVDDNTNIKFNSFNDSFIFACLETLKDQHETLNKITQPVKAFQRYITDVLIHLQYFYMDNSFFYDHIKPFKKILKKSVINYLKNWKNGSLSADEDVFSCPYELELISWLLKEEDSRDVKNVVQIDTSEILKLYSLFQIVVAHLTRKVASGNLSEAESSKYVQSLLFLIQGGNAVERDEEDGRADVISYNLSDQKNYYKNCLNCLFLNKHLLDNFDLFKKKNSASQYSTRVVIEVLMKNETVRSSPVKTKLERPWKMKFLNQIKFKLKKNKMVTYDDDLKTVLNFFDYDQVDVEDVVELFVSVSDLNLFKHELEPSMWTVIFVKFSKMSCLTDNSRTKIIEKLSEIWKHFSKENNFNIELIDNCFVCLLRQQPQLLPLINNDFLEVILRRTNINPSTIILVKLLLNDPNKVNHFLDFVPKNLNKSIHPELLFSSLSALMIDDDLFTDVVKSENVCLVWKISQIDEHSSNLYGVLENVYKKFSNRIIEVMRGAQDAVLLNNLRVIRTLIKLFIAKKDIKLLKGELCEGRFHAELTFEALKKLNLKKTTQKFVKGLLVLFSHTINSSNEIDEEVLWPKYSNLVEELVKFFEDFSWDSVESSEWKEFTKLVLGHCFGSSKHPSLLKILRLLVAANKSEDLGLLFQMVISHSQFLNIILGKTALKAELIELLSELIERNSSEMSSKHIPILLASYTSSLSRCDQILLKILRMYEKNGVNISDYEPFVWGETAISHYSIGSSPGLSLWQQFTMANVLDMLDMQKIEYSLKRFPIHRSLEINQLLPCYDSDVYDPAFLLPLFVNLLSPGSVVFCLSFLYKGALSYTVRALSSECADVRMVASVILSRFYNHLELNPKMKQKLVWMHFVNCIRYGIEDLSANSLPNITTLFFARMTIELSKPPAEMYPPLQNYLLAKSYFSYDSIPEFLPLFHSSEVSHWKHRHWWLEVLRDGTKTNLDLNVIYRTMSLKVIFCFFHSPLCDNDTKKLILQVLQKILEVDKSVLIISEYSLLNWISSINLTSCQVILCDLVNLISTSASVIINNIKFCKGSHTNLSHLIQVFNISVKLLPAIKSSSSKEIFQVYIKTIFDILLLFVNSGRYNWFKFNVNKLTEIIETGIVILGDKFDFGKFTKISFFFRDHEEDTSDVVEYSKRSVFLFSMLARNADKE